MGCDCQLLIKENDGDDDDDDKSDNSALTPMCLESSGVVVPNGMCCCGCETLDLSEGHFFWIASGGGAETHVPR